MSNNAERFEFLDGLRGIAAVSVAWMHALGIWDGGDGGFGNVGLAVDFFFCLSGFVVAHAYDRRLVQGMTVAAFMEKRLVRLYPMILLGVLLGALAVLYIGDDPPGQLALETLGTLALLPVGLLDNGLSYPLNVPMWSLFFEILACLAYAIFAKVVPPRWTVWILPGLALALAGAILVAGQVTNFGLFGIGSFAAGLIRVAYPFLLGVFFHRLNWGARAPRVAPWAGVCLLVAVLFMPTVPNAQAIYQALAVLMLLPGVLLIGVVTRTQKKKLWNTLGRLSYPLYLVHWPVLLASHEVIGGALPSPLAAVVGLCLAIAVSYMVLVIYDEPLRAWLGRRRLGRASVAS